MTDFTIQVLEIIKNIPHGKVMTYGQIAAYAGQEEQDKSAEFYIP